MRIAGARTATDGALTITYKGGATKWLLEMLENRVDQRKETTRLEQDQEEIEKCLRLIIDYCSWMKQKSDVFAPTAICSIRK